ARTGRLLAALVGSLLLATAAGAKEDFDATVREIAAGLRCPVCQNLSVAESPSEMAREMKALIADQLAAGTSPDEIRAYFVSKYGEWILLSPSARGFGLLLWVLPGLSAAVGLGGAAWILRRWARRGAAPPAPVDAAALARVRALVHEAPSALPPEGARLVEGLRELEFDHRAGKLSADDYEELRTLYETRAALALAALKEPPRGAPAEGATEAPRAERAPRAPAFRAWRWVAAALFLVGFGAAIGFFLPRSLRSRDGGSMTGGFLTGTGNAALPVESRDLPALLDQGRRAMEAEDLGRALRLFQRALEVDPEHPGARAYLGLILLRGGHPDRALTEFDRALSQEPKLAQALWGKGLVLYEAPGKTGEAIRTWEALMAQDLSREDRDHVGSVLAQARQRLEQETRPAQKASR
ncbi:MAG: cytochrome c-type biogenesis protein CcmH, partial [Candidatus Rokubacteria bacterium]|nr:cytochrome c-type biogenesis protein CcmH [Candidatus Rokubacteria bacterium]